MRCTICLCSSEGHATVDGQHKNTPISKYYITRLYPKYSLFKWYIDLYTLNYLTSRATCKLNLQSLQLAHECSGVKSAVLPSEMWRRWHDMEQCKYKLNKTEVNVLRYIPALHTWLQQRLSHCFLPGTLRPFVLPGTRTSLSPRQSEEKSKWNSRIFGFCCQTRHVLKFFHYGKIIRVLFSLFMSQCVQLCTQWGNPSRMSLWADADPSCDHSWDNAATQCVFWAIRSVNTAFVSSFSVWIPFQGCNQWI